MEEQIGKRKKGVIPIDLKVMLEEVAQEKLGKLRGEYKRKKRGFVYYSDFVCPILTYIYPIPIFFQVLQNSRR